MNNKKPTSLEIHKFEEERARRILAYCFPSKYREAELSESPDIIVPKLSIGVEVTIKYVTTCYAKFRKGKFYNRKA